MYRVEVVEEGGDKVYRVEVVEEGGIGCTG